MAIQKAEIQEVHGRYLVATKLARDALGREYSEDALDITDSVLEIVKRRVAWDSAKAVGANPEEAIRSMARDRGWGEVKMGSKIEDGDGYDWGYRFTADGTGFKAAGVNVPGGCVLTWWK